MMGKAGQPVSPLAPTRFPDLPVIAGVEFASGAAGVKYQGRTDVTLIRIAPGSAIAGAFTRSSTRAACVLDNQAKLASGGDADLKARSVATLAKRKFTSNTSNTSKQDRRRLNFKRKFTSNTSTK